MFKTCFPLLAYCLFRLFKHITGGKTSYLALFPFCFSSSGSLIHLDTHCWWQYPGQLWRHRRLPSWKSSCSADSIFSNVHDMLQSTCGNRCSLAGFIYCSLHGMSPCVWLFSMTCHIAVHVLTYSRTVSGMSFLHRCRAEIIRCILAEYNFPVHVPINMCFCVFIWKVQIQNGSGWAVERGD